MTERDRKEYKHPSYGMIAFNRTTGGPRRLFGSPLDDHHATVRIVIGSGTRIHELNCDRYHGSLRGEHIEVEMSAAQFAEVLTSMNQGSGIPCTIRYMAGVRIPDPPPVETEATKIKNDFEKNLVGYGVEMKKRADEILKLTEKLPAKVRERVRIELEVMQNQLTSNVPFVVRQFNEAATRVVTAAKHEIDSFARGVFGDKAPQLAPSTAKALPSAEPDKLADALATRDEIAAANPISIKELHTLAWVNERVANSENKTQTFHAEQLASAIGGYLKEFEQLEDARNEKNKRFYHAGAWASRHQVAVMYISYQNNHTLTIAEAERYLAWLDAGNIGTHWEALKGST